MSWGLPTLTSALCRLLRVPPALVLSASAALLPGLHADDPHRRPRGRPACSGAGPSGLLRQRQPGHVRHRRQVGGPAEALETRVPPRSKPSRLSPGAFPTTASTAAAARRLGTTSAATAAARATPAPPATPVSTSGPRCGCFQDFPKEVSSQVFRCHCELNIVLFG